jgi:hypothetical protein
MDTRTCIALLLHRTCACRERSGELSEINLRPMLDHLPGPAGVTSKAGGREIQLKPVH